MMLRGAGGLPAFPLFVALELVKRACERPDAAGDCAVKAVATSNSFSGTATLQ